MGTNRLFRNILIVVILAFNISCDQISKNIVRNTILPDQQFHYFNNHVMLTRVENSGAFLSLGDALSFQIKFIILIMIPMIALLVAIYFLFVKTILTGSNLVAISFIAGGGFGNIYDRSLYGSVTDFMHIDFILFRTGIFNMADVSIMVGAFIMIVSIIIKRQRNSVINIDGDGSTFPVNQIGSLNTHKCYH